MFKIRLFSFTDLNKVLQISKISFPKKRLYTSNFFQKHYRLYPEGFMVADEQNVIGFVLGLPKNNKVEVISLAVEPIWRQQGVGTKLINSLIKHFKESGFRELFIYVRTKNEIAVSFYQCLDFNTLKTVKKHYSNGDNAYLMVKPI